MAMENSAVETWLYSMVLDTLQVDQLFDPHLRSIKASERLQDSPECTSSNTVDILDKQLSKRRRTDTVGVGAFGAAASDIDQCQRTQSMVQTNPFVNGQQSTFKDFQGNHLYRNSKPHESKRAQKEVTRRTLDYKEKSNAKAAALSLSLDFCDTYKQEGASYGAQLCEAPVFNGEQVIMGSDQGMHYVKIDQTTACMGQSHNQQGFMQNQTEQSNHKQEQLQEFMSRKPPIAYKVMDEQQEIMLQPSLSERRDDMSSKTLNVSSDVHVAVNSSDEEGLELLSLLLQCAEAVATDNLDMANALIPLLNEMSSPYGNPIQRVAAYFTEGMAARVVNSCLGICSPLPAVQKFCNQSISSAFQIFNGLCPYVKFSHFTANQAILEAFEGHQRVHIIDCDIMQGLQWPALFHILASRPEGPPCVRITGIGTSLEALEATGKRLSDFANTLCMPFEFHSVADRVGNLNLAALKVRQGDALAVHWLQHSLYDVTGSDSRTLHLFQQLKPTVLTIVEQDLSHAGAFLDRFVEALHYYSALFDSVGESHAESSEERHAVEQQLFSSEMKNIVAVGGPARTGEVKYDNWKTVMGSAGFKQVSLAGNAATQATLLLNMFPSEGYSLSEEDGVLKLGWKDLSLYTASAWCWPASLHHL
ncbi:hypothetical protein GOP47_0002418 [Adiantum capillus-veneris]|uniref:Protein SCARECROW-like n=1 Tax=Adiantum capillus-veneris TaxID=13818 RepID=A0A9D4ZRL9_ADICA|nr:hypothetical protein GOP47_0002418 [Adiantum capillus-veneris]